MEKKLVIEYSTGEEEVFDNVSELDFGQKFLTFKREDILIVINLHFVVKTVIKEF